MVYGLQLTANDGGMIDIITIHTVTMVPLLCSCAFVMLVCVYLLGRLHYVCVE